ncbi:MAG: hypothetical protein ACI9WC_003773, partial [Arenicella sp.]
PVARRVTIANVVFVIPVLASFDLVTYSFLETIAVLLWDRC